MELVSNVIISADKLKTTHLTLMGFFFSKENECTMVVYRLSCLAGSIFQELRGVVFGLFGIICLPSKTLLGKLESSSWSEVKPTHLTLV